jgi:hypothetical protein
VALDRDLDARRLIARRKSFGGELASARRIGKSEWQGQRAGGTEGCGWLEGRARELSTPGYFSLRSAINAPAIAGENFGGGWRGRRSSLASPAAHRFLSLT